MEEQKKYAEYFEKDLVEFREKIEREGGIAEFIKRNIPKRESYQKYEWSINEDRFFKREKWKFMSIQEKEDYIFDYEIKYLIKKGAEIDEAAKKRIRERIKDDLNSMDKLILPEIKMKDVIEKRIKKIDKR